MDKRTAEALEKSIKHWRSHTKVKSLRGLDVYNTGCALCSMFFDNHCRGCPVSARSGYRYCIGTPYISARNAFEGGNGNLVVFVEKAKTELDFLISLREPVEGVAP